MATGFNIEVKGINEAAAYLKKESSRIEKEANEGVLQAVMHMEGEVKKSISGHYAEPTSVDTGRFMGSVASQVSNGIGYVYTQVKYAPFLEYGTSRIAPRYHFRNSLERNRNKIREIIASRIAKTI